MEITQIIKRDYETSEFVLNKITNAIEKAMISVGNGTRVDAEMISQNVLKSLLERKENHVNYIPTVEQVQDIVEDELMHSAFLMLQKRIFYIEMSKLETERQIFLKSVLI